MSWNRSKNSNDQMEEWGGPWTQKKLTAFANYVKAYLMIMKKHPRWKTIYFDGFAGSGTRGVKRNTQLMEQLSITEEEERPYKGAAERVLGVEGLGFDYYYFIDCSQKSLDKLKSRLEERYQDKQISYRAGDANHQLTKLAEAMRTDKFAALVFLDPFGMQIDWDSIAELKGTRTDLWILVPTGIIVNRLLDKAGNLDFSDKLQSFFGLPIEEIKTHFYKEEVVQTLFGDETIVTKVTKPIDKIARLYAERMKTIWKYVIDRPLVLRSRNSSPLFHFVFASNNKTAIKIANQIIESI